MERPKKVDNSVNGDAKRLVEEHNQRKEQLYPLKIDDKTTIYVKKEKRTPEYAEYKRNLFNGLTPEKKGGGSRMHESKKDALIRLIEQGKSMDEICSELSLCRSTVRKYIKLLKIDIVK